MPVTADAITHRKLVLAKNMYRRAVIQSATEHSPLDRMFAVLTFDLAIETVLKAALSALDPTIKLESDLNWLIQKCDAVLVARGWPPTPDARQIRDVRKIRNAVQHEARIPNPSEVNDSRTYTRDFLEKFTDQVWGLSFERLRLSDLVKNEEAREFLTKAEEAFDSGDYQTAVQQANVGLNVALVYMERPAVGLRAASPKAFVMDDGEPDSGELAFHAFNQMRQTVLYLALGLDAGQFIRFRKLAGQVTYSLDSVGFEFSGTKESLTADEAEWVIAYCFDALTGIEARVGNLEAPYGVRWWEWA